MKMKQVHILWSGGFDSTFRMIELIRMKNIEIFPYYLELGYELRPSAPEERKAIHDNFKLLIERKDKTVYLHEPQFVRDVNPSDDIRAAREELFGIFRLPQQWMYFGEFAKLHPGLEVCFQKFSDNRSDNISQMLFENNAMLIDKDGVGRLDKFHCRMSTYTIFKDLTFPIINQDNHMMLRLYYKWHFEKILKNIIFCRNNFNGKPCGFCNTCLQKLYAKLYSFFDKEALRRYMVDIIMKQYLFSLIKKGVVKNENYYDWRSFNRKSMRALCLKEEPVYLNDVEKEYVEHLKFIFALDYDKLLEITKMDFSYKR